MGSDTMGVHRKVGTRGKDRLIAGPGKWRNFCTALRGVPPKGAVETLARPSGRHSHLCCQIAAHALPISELLTSNLAGPDGSDCPECGMACLNGF